jgi:hypothetical protein
MTADDGGRDGDGRAAQASRSRRGIFRGVKTMIEIRQRRYPLDIQFERTQNGTFQVTLCAPPSPYARGPEAWTNALQKLGCPATARHPADWPADTAHVPLWSYSPEFDQ